jgi:K+-transporting ATPase ATPase C chain
MKTFVQSFMMLLGLTILTGVIYPLAVTAAGNIFYKDRVHGQIVRNQDQPVASRLIAQKITSLKYFWPRPSAADYNAAASAASNLGPTSADLKKLYDERKKSLMAAHPDDGEPPQDLLFASGSGLDPEISPAAAFYQLNRVAKARNLNPEQSARLKTLVESLVQKPTLGFLGDSRLNVMDLNLALDSMKE